MGDFRSSDLPDFSGPAGVADEEWRRVRDLAERVVEIEEIVARMVDPDAESLARLDRARVKAAKAVQRAELADHLADVLESIRSERRRRS
jgi:hypothetical protein